MGFDTIEINLVGLKVPLQLTYFEGHQAHGMLVFKIFTVTDKLKFEVCPEGITHPPT